VSSPDFDWNSEYGLYLQGKEKIRERAYPDAEKKMRESLSRNPDYLPALTDLSMLLFLRMRYEEALTYARRALSVDTYDAAANYHYGLINSKLGNMADAKDGYEIASMGMEYRSAAYARLSGLYLKEMNHDRSVLYSRKSLDFNHYGVDAWQLLAVNYRMTGAREEAEEVLDTLIAHDPLSHFVRFERYLWKNTEEKRAEFTGMIRNELPGESYLALGLWYFGQGRREEALRVMELAPDNAEVMYWRAYLSGKALDHSRLRPEGVFPYRQETGEMLEQMIKKCDHWMLKYHLALIHWNMNNRERAGELFDECGVQPDYPPFYAARASFRIGNKNSGSLVFNDLNLAYSMDPHEWRYGRNLATYFLNETLYKEALQVADASYRRFPDNYTLGLLNVQALMKNGYFGRASEILKKIHVLPTENATLSKKLHKETHLMLALGEMGKKNYRNALKYIDISRQWPDNLGVGKPYDSDIDERLEDWLAMHCWLKLGNKRAAGEKLAGILSFKPQVTAYINTFSSVNNLVSAWALRQSGKPTEAEVYLRDWVKREPSSALAQWTADCYHGKDTVLADETKADENYRILNRFIQIYGNEH